MRKWFDLFASKGISHSIAAPSTPINANVAIAVAGIVAHPQFKAYTNGIEKQYKIKNVLKCVT